MIVKCEQKHPTPRWKTVREIPVGEPFMNAGVLRMVIVKMTEDLTTEERWVLTVETGEFSQWQARWPAHDCYGCDAFVTVTTVSR